MFKNNNLYKYIKSVLYNEIVKVKPQINNASVDIKESNNQLKDYEENKDIKYIYNVKENDDFVIIKNKDSLDTEQSIVQELEYSEIVSLSSNDDELRNINNNKKFVKEYMCNTCNSELSVNNEYKCIKIERQNQKYKYYCLSCGFKKKENLKNTLNMNLIYTKNKE